jgi:hypothetical protein
MAISLAVVNSTIQVGAILSYQYFALVWPLYIVMGFLTLLIIMQTIAAGALFSGSIAEKKEIANVDGFSTNFILTILYMLSCYHIHLIGYTVFASIAVAHTAILMSTIIFTWIKK